MINPHIVESLTFSCHTEQKSINALQRPGAPYVLQHQTNP
jgi:hypothetical protein